MNPEVKKQWLTALRSGDYKQGKFTLRTLDGDSYCCLAVLCDLYAGQFDKQWEKTWSGYSFLGSESTLPVDVMNWAGLKEIDPEVYPNGEDEELVPLSCVNDDIGLDFNGIAQLIEEQL